MEDVSFVTDALSIVNVDLTFVNSSFLKNSFIWFVC